MATTEALKNWTPRFSDWLLNATKLTEKLKQWLNFTSLNLPLVMHKS